MGALLRIRKIVWFLKSGDYTNPLHVHARVGTKECKIMLPSLRVARNEGFSKSELRAIVRLTETKLELLILRIKEREDGTED